MNDTVCAQMVRISRLGIDVVSNHINCWLASTRRQSFVFIICAYIAAKDRFNQFVDI